MPLDERALPDRIARLVFEGLKTIGADDSKWHTKPRTVEMTVDAGEGDIAAPKPALFVFAGGCRPAGSEDDSAMAPLDATYERMMIHITCITENPEDPHGEIHKLAADVRRWIRENTRPANGLLDSGGLFDHGYELKVEKSSGRSGLGYAVVTAVAHVTTADSTDLS